MKKPSYVVNSIHIISLIIWKKVKLKHFKTWVVISYFIESKENRNKAINIWGFFYLLSVPIDASTVYFMLVLIDLAYFITRYFQDYNQMLHNSQLTIYINQMKEVFFSDLKASVHIMWKIQTKHFRMYF